MFKILLGAAIVVVLVGFGVISSHDVKRAGDTVVSFAKDDVQPFINRVAQSISELTK